MQMSFTQQFYEILERKKSERGWMGNFADRYGIAQSVLSKIISHESENPRLANVAKIVDGLIADGDWQDCNGIREGEQDADIVQLLEKVDVFEKEVDLLQKNNAALEKSNAALEKIVKLMEAQTETVLIEKQNIIDSLNISMTATEREAESLKQQHDQIINRLETVLGERDALESEKRELLEKMQAEKAEFETSLSNALAFADAVKNVHHIEDNPAFSSYMKAVEANLDLDRQRDSAFFLSIFLQMEKLREQIILRGIFRTPAPADDEQAADDSASEASE
jgi:vacuolar-type H+-ATPase subunit I/STV1